MIPEVPATITTEASPPAAVETTPVVQSELPPPSTEQIHTSDQLFSQDGDRMVAGLIGIWTSVAILHDLAVEAFTPSEEEKLQGEKKPAVEEPSAGS
jgi:hypothetical protein